MKAILPILALTVFASCVPEILKVEYQSTTMMGKTVISATPDSVIVSFNGRGEPKRDARATEEGEWDLIMAQLESVDLKTMADLVAPSEKRFTDAAPYAKFMIHTKDSVYSSCAFDGGNPPAELKTLESTIKKVASGEKD